MNVYRPTVVFIIPLELHRRVVKDAFDVTLTCNLCVVDFILNLRFVTLESWLCSWNNVAHENEMPVQ